MGRAMRSRFLHSVRENAMGRGKAPRKEERQRTWSVRHLKGGGEFYGWVAGPHYGVHVHYMRPSKPCHSIFTDEELECPYEKIRPTTEWKGYLPLYDECGRPVVVICSSNMFDQLEQLKTYQAVRVSRGEDSFDSVVVTPYRALGDYKPSLPERKREADIEAWLFETLFREEPLVRWLKKRGTVPATTEKPPVFLPGDDPKYRAAAKKANKGYVPHGPVGEEMIRRGLVDPPTIGEIIPVLNGVHKRKE
jgi:hypothetical protein